METIIQQRQALPAPALDQLFLEARTHSHWLPAPVPQHLLEQLYSLARMGPTSLNASPARFLFLTTEESKQRLLPALMPGNREQTRTAPITVLIAWDTEFYEHLPKLFPHGDFRPMFTSNPSLAAETAFRNSSLEGAYFLLAARALGLDAGPMSGFDADKVNAEFFSDGKWKVNFISNLGYGDHSKVRPRLPRLDFDEACKII